MLGTVAATAAVGALGISPARGLAVGLQSAQSTGVYAGPEQLYETFGVALRELVADPAAAELRAVNAVVAIEFTDTTAQIGLVLSPDAAAVELGEADARADVRLSLSGDLAHALASGEVSIADSVLDPDLGWSADPPDKVRALISLPGALVPFYIGALEAAGLTGLIPAPSAPVFTSEQDLYGALGLAVREAVGGPQGAGLRRIDAMIALRFTDPDSELSLRLAEDAAVHFGPVDQEPAAVVRMSGDVAHRLFSGALGLAAAIGRGHLTYEGDTAALARLAILPAAVRPHYQRQAQSGLSDA